VATIVAVLNLLEDLETSMRDIYHWLSTELAHEPEVSRLFRRLSSEEEAHAELVRYQKRLVRQNPDKFATVSTELDELDEVLAFVRGILDTKPEMDVDRALKLAMDLESLDEERLYRRVVGESCPELLTLVENLSHNDEQHVQLLTSFIDQYRNKASNVN